MDRRDFLRIASWSGLSCVMPTTLATWEASAQSNTYTGTYWIFMHAGGGWDPTHLCDPKGRASENENDPMGRFNRGDIRSAGNINYAPIDIDLEAGQTLDTFFQTNYQRLLVLNGVDTGTNGHDQGVRGTWSGRTAEGHPPIGALIAAAYGPTLPMPLIGYGGYLDTQGVTNAVPLGDGGLLHNLAHPSRIDPEDSEENFFGHPEVPAVVQTQQTLRLARLQERTVLPRIWDGQNELTIARMGQDELKRVSEALPEEFAGGRLERQIQVALAAYSAGLSVSVSVSMGGFDTHGNHDDNHLPRLVEFVNAADFAVKEAERLGIADKVAIVMGSDFGRTPGYNGGNGKDHWPVTSMMMMGPGIPGNRVIGATDERHGIRRLDPVSFADVGDADSDSGVRLSIAHVHRALRDLSGVPQDMKAAFPLAGEDLPLFSGV